MSTTGMVDEVKVSGDVASRLRAAAEQYGLEPEWLVDYLLDVFLAAEPALPKKKGSGGEKEEEDYSGVLERLKNLGYT